MKLAAKLCPLAAALAVAACSESTAVQSSTFERRNTFTPAAEPTSVTIASSFQSELGCSGDWQPDCSGTDLIYNAEDGIWQRPFTVPAGTYEYKAALNGTWDENYGRLAILNGPNIPLTSSGGTGQLRMR